MPQFREVPVERKLESCSAAVRRRIARYQPTSVVGFKKGKL